MGRYLHIVKKDYAGALEQYTLGLKADPNNAVLLARAARAEQTLGRWDDATAHLAQAARLDPRSVITARAYAVPAARRAPLPGGNGRGQPRLGALAHECVRWCRPSPPTSSRWGCSTAHRRRSATRLKRIDTTIILVRFSKYQEQMWVLDPELWPRITRLTPADFDGDRGHWGLKVGGTWKLLGDTVKARAFGDSARLAFEAQLATFPDECPAPRVARTGPRARRPPEGSDRGGRPLAQDARDRARREHRAVRPLPGGADSDPGRRLRASPGPASSHCSA